MIKLKARLPFQGINLVAFFAQIGGAYVCGGMAYFLGTMLNPDHASFKLVLSLLGLMFGYGSTAILAGKLHSRKMLPSLNK